MSGSERVLRHVKCFALCSHSTILKQSNLFSGSGLEKLQKHILENFMPSVLEQKSRNALQKQQQRGL